MRVVVQRVSQASVSIQPDGQESHIVGQIGKGLCLFVGIGKESTKEHATYLAKKVSSLRIYPNDEGKMFYNVKDCQGEVLVISQFTLYGNCRNGNRPDFTDAAPPEQAEALYSYFVSELEREIGKPVQQGRFREMMQVSLINDGPVTILIESQ